MIIDKTKIMAHITFEQFLHHTNAEEIIVKKMREAGPRIYQLNYDRRLKHCKVLYTKFYDAKLRDTVLAYGLVLKPMPNSFKTKFLQFPQKNNDGEYNSSDTLENKSLQKKKNKLPPLEEEYKDDLPSTSTAFVHKPRLTSPPAKNIRKTKNKLKPESQKQPNSKRDVTSSITYKIPTKSAPKRRKSLEKKNSTKKSPKITKYFNSNALNIKVDEQPIPEGNMKLRKRISDPPNENIEIEPQTKRQKISPAKKSDTKREPEILKSNISPLISKKNPKNKNNKEKMKKGKKIDGKKNSLNKSKTIIYSDDFVSDDCDINTNNSIINLTSEDSRENIPQVSPDKRLQNSFSPLKSALPKRNRIEDFGEASNNISKKLLNEITPEKVKKTKNGFTKNEIELWITEGQKALEDHNKTPCKEARPDKTTSREDVSVDYKLETIKTHPDKVKKYIKYWLKFEIQMRKGINLEATVVCEISRAKILSTFNQMTYEDFKNLINVQRYVSHWTSLGKSIDELEQNLKKHYTAFIEKEKSWPAFHIELAALQSYLHSKGIKGLIPLKNIPPRVLSFDEVLEKTNIKECISLSCDKPPESYTELMNLCKKEYEKCCCKGVWTEGLKFNDKGEEGVSSQEMSIELFTEPSMLMSPLKVTHSENIQENVAQKELPILQNLENSGSSKNVIKELSSNGRNEFADQSQNSTQNSTIKKRKSRKCGPKSRRKNSSRSEDDLEIQINQICGDEEQPVLKNTIEPVLPIDTQELNRILSHSQTQPSSDMGKEILHSEKKNSSDITVATDSKTYSMEVVDNKQKDVTKQPYESLIKTKQTPHETSVPPAMDNLITPSPNIFAYSDETYTKCSDIQITNNSSNTPSNVSKKKLLLPLSPNIFANSGETNTKCSNIQMANESPKTPPNVVSKKTPMPSSEMDGLMSTTNVKSSDKQPKPPEKENLFPLSPNIFQSSGESYSKIIESDLIDVQTQESVYVPCQTNNDFLTEQNNFSITMNEVSESEDPFSSETNANKGETIVVRLDPSYVEGNTEKSSGENAQLNSDELNIPEKSTSVIENLNPKQVVMQNSIYSQESIVSKELSLSCQVDPVEPQENTDSHQTHLSELNVSEKSMSGSGNLDLNEVEDIKDSEETIVLKKLLLSCQTVPEKSPETTNNNKQKNDICSTEPSSNPSYETSAIVDCVNTTLEPTTHLNTDAVNLAEIAYDKEKENSITMAQSIEPTSNFNDVTVNLAKTVQNRNNKLLEENVPSIQPEQNPSINSECVLDPAENQKDTNVNGKQTGAKLTSDHDMISNKNTKKNVNNIETDLNSSAESIRNVKVVVKREIFSQSFSQYDDDVQIIEIPQSEPMVIDDEETAPELLEALLCGSPPQIKGVPMPIVHTSISHVTPFSISMGNLPQAQQFPSNFDLTQSQSNLNQSCNVSTAASSDNVNFQNVNKKTNIGTTTKNTVNVCESSDCHKFKTPQKQDANRNYSANILLKKSPGSPEATETKSRKKTSDRKRKLVSNKPVCSSKSKDERQLSEEMSEMSYVSIAPQNIPSEIELTQTSSKADESAKHMGNAKMVSKDNKQNKKSRNNTQESGMSMGVCISDSFDETKITSMNLEQSKNIEKNIKSEECLTLNNNIPDLSPPDESKDVETTENSKDNPGNGLSWYDIVLEATKELKNIFEELSGIDEEDTGCKNEEEKQVISALEDSLDRSSDVQFLEEMTEDDIEDAVSVEISNNNNLSKDYETHDREVDKCFSNPSRDIAQKQVTVCGDNDFIKEKGSSNNSDFMDMEVSKTKGLSIESKRDYVETLNRAEATPRYCKENLNKIELRKENNTPENVNTSVELVLSINDSGDVELLEESEEDDDVPVDCIASLSQPSSIINKKSKSIPENKEANAEVAEKLNVSLSEEDADKNEQTVEKILYPTAAPQTKRPLYHVPVNDTNTFEICKFNEMDAKTCGEAEHHLEDKHIEESIKPLKACRVRIPKVKIYKTGLSAEVVHTNRKRLVKAAKCQLAKGNEEVLLAKEDCQVSKMAGHPEGSNLVIQAPTEVKLTEKESEIENLPSKDTVTSLYNDLDPIENPISQNLNEKYKDKSKTEQEQSSSNGTKSNSKNPSKPIQISTETCQNWVIKVPDVLMTSLTTVSSQNLETTTVVADHSSVNINSDVEDIAVESNSTKQEIESVTVEHCKSSETNEDLFTRSPISGRLKTNVPDVSKNIDETPLSAKTSQDHDKSDTNISSISEKPKVTIDEYEPPASCESFSESSQANNKSKNTSEYVNENLEDDIKELTQLEASNENFTTPSLDINKAKNTSDNETYSESFGRMDNTNAKVITTSTQVELPVSNQKENSEENHIAPETSSNSSVEFIDFSFYYNSSDNDNTNQNNDTKKEEKFSHTLNFKELSISKKNTADASKTLNDANIENEDLLKNLSEGSECILPVNMPSIIQGRSSIDIAKVSEIPKIIFNRNEADSSCNKSFSVLSTNPKISFNLNKSYDSAISNNLKTTISEENLLKTKTPVCENKTSNSLIGVESVELTDKEDFETSRKLSKDCDPVNRAVLTKNKSSKAKPPENSSNQENLQLSKSLQSEVFEENNTFSLKKCYILKEDNTLVAIDNNLIDKRSSDENKDLSSIGRNQCTFSKHSKNIQEAVEQVMKIKRNANKIIRRRSTSEQHQSVNNSVMTFSFSQPSEIHHFDVSEKFPHHSEIHEKKPHHPEVPQTSPKSDSQRSFKDSSRETTEITTKNLETIMSKKLKTITLQGFILTSSLRNIQPSNGDYVEVPIMIEKRILNILPPIAKMSESIQTNPIQEPHAIKVNLELKVDDQQPVNIEDPTPIPRDELKCSIISLSSCDEKGTNKLEEVTAQENTVSNNPPKKLPIQLVHKAKTKITQPTTSKKKTTPKKSSKLPDFVQQKIHAFSSIPLKPCNKPTKNKPSSLLTVEECDFLIEDASQPIATTSQILGTDCTYFENSELLRNLDEICIPHHPEIPELQIEQLPAQVAASTPNTCKVINLIPITMSEGVTARKVWQVNLHWKTQRAMSIEVRFSVNRRSMTVFDESAKLLFTFKPEIWSDVHRILREINHFEYKRTAFKNQLKSTSLHKVLRQLFHSSTQIVDVKLINDNFNPYTICEKTIPVYRKPFQCLTKGIAPDILSKMKFLKEKLQDNNNYEPN